MIFFVVLIILYSAIELLIFILQQKKKSSRKRQSLQSLYKLMEIRVLNRTLQNRVSTEQAAYYEYQQLFVRIEFLDTKPWLSYLFAMDECVTVGRSKENKVCIRDDLLSRMHCKIMAQNNVLYLQDMGTTNGTKIKRGWFHKMLLMPNNIVELKPGDIIYVGHYKMKIATYYGYQVYA